jgi:hypothetical protein
MLRFLEDLSTPTGVVVEFGGRVGQSDVAAVRSRVGAAIEAAGPDGASLVLRIDEIPHFENVDAIEGAARNIEQDATKLVRIAWVSDVSLIEHGAPVLAFWLKAQKRTFPSAALEDAVAWAQER